MSSAEEKSFSDKLSVIKNKITDYIDKKNIRQVKKYLSELKALEEKFDSIDINDKYSKVADLSDIAEEFIFEYEGKEINNRNKDLLKVRINDLSLAYVPESTLVIFLEISMFTLKLANSIQYFQIWVIYCAPI